MCASFDKRANSDTHLIWDRPRWPTWQRSSRRRPALYSLGGASTSSFTSSGMSFAGSCEMKLPRFVDDAHRCD
jgi:hypothetical protein